MQDNKGILQAGIIAVLVVIAGLLFSISRKLDNPSAVAAQPVALAQPAVMAPPAVTQPAVVAPVPAPLPEPARKPSPVSPASPRVVATSTHSTAASTPESSRTVSAPSASSAAPPPPQDSGSNPVYPPSVYSSSPSSVSPPPPPPPQTRTVTVPAGTAFTVRLLDRIDSDRNRSGDTFQASLDEALVADGVVIAARGANVTGRLVQTKQSGRVSGLAEMSLELVKISTIAGEQNIASDTMQKEAPSSRGKDAATVGVMSGIGAAIGAIAGGRRGAGIGAGAGATGGVIDVMATRGKSIKLEPESRLTFRLKAPLTVTADGSAIQRSQDNSVNGAANPNSPSSTAQTDRSDRPYLRRRN